ncbi:MAG: hypothetical protein AAFQ23_13035 [Cyanobacteria bacterium J06623_1]
MRPFKKQFSLSFIFACFSLILLAAGGVSAETKQIKYSSASSLKAWGKITPHKDRLPLLPSPGTKSTRKNSSVAIESSPTGSPSLRRQPGGERFEPKRIPLKIPLPKQPYRTSPSITIINPSAYGASWGSAGIGFGVQERSRFTNQADGVIGLGFGLGNPRKNIGAQIGISLVDVSAPYRDGAVNVKLHRRLAGDLSLALGAQGITTWGNTDGGSSVYGAASTRFKLRQDRTKALSEIYATLGVGGGQFRSESDINDGNETVGVFGSVAVKVIQPVGFVAEWSGQDLTIGIPLVPFRKLPLVIVPALTDITGSAGDGTRLIVGLGYSFSF